MKISVFGLGYVGLVSAACLADLGHNVIGVDVAQLKVDMVNAGRSPVIEPEIDELLSRIVAEGRLRAISDPVEAVCASQASLICVGTPSRDNGSVDLTYVKQVSWDIGEALAKHSGYHVVIARSTMLPGSTEMHVIPTIEAASGRQAGLDFGVCYNPEFMREGKSVYDFYHPPFTLVGSHDSQATETAAAVYKDIHAPFKVVPIRVAEIVKYANNAFHALKVTFANEIGNLCKQANIDSHLVMDIFCMDKKLNISESYLRPGFAFGGSCLPKDLRALLHYARHNDLQLPVLEAILPSNHQQVEVALEMIAKTNRKHVGVLGLSFKAGTDDLRESPVVTIIERLIGKGYSVSIYDRNVSLAHLQGANKAYIEQEIPHIASLMCDSIDTVLAEAEVIVLGNQATEFRDVLTRVRSSQMVIDLVRTVDSVESLDGRYRGICW